MPSSVLTINGVSYNQAGRKSASYVVDRWGWDLDNDFSLEFHEYSAGPQPALYGPVPVSLTVDGNLRFTGDTMSDMPAGPDTPEGRIWSYRALGLKYRANWLPVVAVDGSGLMRFNTPRTDTDHYVSSNAGKSVGDILAAVLTQHATALTAAGITTDATTDSQLAARTLVPAEEVLVQGERLWNALEGVIQRWDRNQRLVILPSGLVRLIDVAGGTSRTITVGTDPVQPPLFTRCWTHCATRTIVRGKGDIAGGYVSTLRGTLTPAWSGADEAAWTIFDFESPGAAKDTGTVVSVDSPTQVTVSSNNALRTWATNFWPGIEAWVNLIKGSGTSLTYQEERKVTANSALSAAGTATLTLDFGLNNSGASDFDEYELIGRNVPLADGGLADVWRLYDVTDPGGLIADHLVPQFPVERPFVSRYGQAAALTTSPTGEIAGPFGGGPAFFQVLPATGQILFYKPVVEQTTTRADLETGGAAVIPPDDVYLLLAYSRGALQTVYPPDSGGPVYSGTAYTQAGLERTSYVDVDAWTYAGNATQLYQLAQMIQESTRDTLMEGTVGYLGYYATLEDPSGGHLLRLPATGYTSGDDTLDIPVRAVMYHYVSGGGGLLYTTEIRCSTRRDPRTGESQYMHLSVLGSGAMFGGQLGGAFSAGGQAFIGGMGITPEALGLDRSAMELGTQAMQEASQFEQGQAAIAAGPSRGPSAQEAQRMADEMAGPSRGPAGRRNVLGRKGVTTTAAEREQAAFGLAGSEATAQDQLAVQVQQDNARRNAGMARGPARDTTLPYGQAADAGDFTGPPRSLAGRGAPPGRRRLRGGASSTFGAGVAGARFGAGLPGLGTETRTSGTDDDLLLGVNE